MMRTKCVRDVNCVLTVNEQNSFFEDDSVHLVTPDWDLIFQMEFRHKMPGLRWFFRLVGFFVFDLKESAIFETNVLAEMIEHYHSIKRRGQRSDEQAVVPLGDNSRNGVGSIATQTIGQQP